MGAYNVVIIKARMTDGRQAVIHVEEISDADPFARCDELMADYGVSVCVVEQLPNYNDACSRPTVGDGLRAHPTEAGRWRLAANRYQARKRTGWGLRSCLQDDVTGVISVTLRRVIWMSLLSPQAGLWAPNIVVEFPLGPPRTRGR